jgi:hypothetical protein
MVIPVGHNRRYGIFHPIRDTVRTDIVKQEHFCLKRDPICLTVTRADRFVVAGTDAFEQILIVKENSFVPTRYQ